MTSLGVCDNPGGLHRPSPADAGAARASLPDLTES